MASEAEIIELAEKRLKEILASKTNNGPNVVEIINEQGVVESDVKKKPCLPCQKKAEEMEKLAQKSIEKDEKQRMIQETQVPDMPEYPVLGNFYTHSPGSCSYCNVYIPWSKLHTPITLEQLAFVETKDLIRMQCGSVVELTQLIMRTLFFAKDASPTDLLRSHVRNLTTIVEDLNSSMAELENHYDILREQHAKEF